MTSACTWGGNSRVGGQACPSPLCDASPRPQQRPRPRSDDTQHWMETEDTVPGCSQWTHPESARLGQPQGWPLSRSVRTTENSTWHREDAGLCQRPMSPHTLARPGPEPSGRTSASGTSSGTFLEEQRKDRAEERRDRPWGTPRHFRTPGPPATYLAIAETVYNGDKKSLWGEGRGSGPEPGSAGGEAAPAPRPGRGRRTWKELKSIS